MTSPGQAMSDRAALERAYARELLGAVEATAEASGHLTAASVRQTVSLTLAGVRAAWATAVVRTRFARDQRVAAVPDGIYRVLSEPPRPGGRDWQGLAAGYARTMATADYNDGALDDMANAGYQAKRWIAHHDSACRDAHRKVDGTAVTLHSAFVVGGFPLQYPGDPSGPPEQVYNCRCVLVPAVRPSRVRAILPLAPAARSRPCQ